MEHDNTNGKGCPGAAEILADLTASNMLHLEPGERLWKLYCFCPTDHPTGLRHRIYTKRKADGRLALITFAAHNPPEKSGNGSAGLGRRVVRSGIARVPDLSLQDLDQIIAAVRRQAQVAKDTCEEVDLSVFSTLDDQIAWLEANR